MASPMLRLLVVVCCLSLSSCVVKLSSHLTDNDKQMIKNLAETTLKEKKTDVQAVYYSTNTLQLLNADAKLYSSACNDQLKSAIDSNNLQQVFFATGLQAIVGGSCRLVESGAANKVADADQQSIEDVYYSLAIKTALKQKFDAKKYVQLLQTLIKAEDSPISYGYLFHAIALLDASALQKKEVDAIIEFTEDVTNWADVVDNKFAQFESGLHATGLIVSGMFKLATKVNVKPKVTNDRLVQFSNYFLMRKYAKQPKNFYTLADALVQISTNKFLTPVSIGVEGDNVASKKKPGITLRASDILGNPIKEVTLTVDSAKHVQNGATIISMKSLSPNAKGLFDLDVLGVNPPSGLYKVIVRMEQKVKSGAQLIAPDSVSLPLKVASVVKVSDAELTVKDVDSKGAGKTLAVVYPSEASLHTIDEDTSFTFSFSLQDERLKQPITVQQAFLRFENKATKQEIIFVAEQDSQTQRYSVEVVFRAKASEFDFKSGDYLVELLIGDSTLYAPIQWTLLSKVAISFPSKSAQQERAFAEEYIFKAQPEIKHQFRQPEARPATTLSLLFAALCLVPILVMFILWLKIGVNMADFGSTMPWSLLFHCCIAAIFGLYGMYWLGMNMFNTLKYLGMLAVPTIYFGNRMLSIMHDRRQK